MVDRGRGEWIGFTGAVPDEAVALASMIPVDVQLLGDRPFSEDDTEARVTQSAFPATSYLALLAAAAAVFVALVRLRRRRRV